MCGIIACDCDQAVETVFQGLKQLEYRGYDSWGMAFLHNGTLQQLKETGRIDLVKEKKWPEASPCIGHTRWATHGKVCQENAHPVLSNNKKIAVVHNGIIENYQELRVFLKGKGFSFETETDTEVVPNLIQFFLQENDFREAVRQTALKLEGRYAFVALQEGEKNLVGARNGSPLVLGLAKQGIIIASDALAFSNKTNKVIFLDEQEMVEVNGQDFKVFNLTNGAEIQKESQELDLETEQAEKQGFDFFMLKEILEQKDSIWAAVEKNRDDYNKVAKLINDSFGTFLVGCGTAGKVCLTGTYLFSRIAKKHVNFAVGSEFPSYEHFLTPKTLMLCVSQSGETADTLEAIKAAKKKNVKVLSVLNAPGTTMERQSQASIFVHAGPEKCVASTKATTGQLTVLTLLAYACAGRLEEGLELMEKTCQEIREMLTEDYLQSTRELAEKMKNFESMYIIGRGLNYPLALEGAIKLQEVSYIHAEGFAGGELKHGPIALIDQGTPCIVLVANDETKTDMLNNAVEVKSRGGFIIGIAPENNEIFDAWIKVPDAGNASPIVNLIPVQLLAYYLATLRGLNPDFPRNLAKSVTVK
jgi:glucosamine--fructose-6-phosphate aminotransferase (isomerizing)